MDDATAANVCCHGDPVKQQRVLFAGRLLADERTLSDYNIQGDPHINVVVQHWIEEA